MKETTYFSLEMYGGWRAVFIVPRELSERLEQLCKEGRINDAYKLALQRCSQREITGNPYMSHLERAAIEQEIKPDGEEV